MWDLVLGMSLFGLAPLRETILKTCPEQSRKIEFSNWLPNSPDNLFPAGCQNQDFLHYYRGVNPNQGPIAAWNDLQDDCPPWIPWSYIIEYSSFVCTERIEGDVNHDCRVNLEDLALMASDWLRCTRMPNTFCTE
jgi:hypothetical protein